MLESNTIRNNVAIAYDNGYGGGVYLWETDAILKGNSIISNAGNTQLPPSCSELEGNGGGMHIWGGDDGAQPCWSLV